MNVIMGTAFSLTLGIFRLRVRLAIEDATCEEPRAACACRAREEAPAAAAR